jgi:hypothetical protein
MKNRNEALPETNGVRDIMPSGEFPAKLANRVHDNRHGQSEPDGLASAQQSALRDNRLDHSKQTST